MSWRDAAVGAVLAAPLAALCLTHGHAVDYYAALNDFWGNAFAADTWAPSARALWNGFYPPGYPTLLAWLPGSRLVVSAYVANVAAGWALLAALFAGVAGLGGRWAAAGALGLVALHPDVATQVLTTGADAPFVAVAVTGALLLHVAATSGRGRDGDDRITPRSTISAVGAGLCLAAAAWLRYHGFVFALGALAAGVVVGGRRAVRPLAIAASIVAVAGVSLLLLGVAAGDVGRLQRAQAFNVFKGHVGAVNWYHLDPGTLPASVGEAIARDPAAFRKSYLAYVAPHLWLAVVPLVAALAARTTEVRRFAVFAGVTSAVFVPLVDLGASPRGVVAAVPLVLAAVVLVIADLVRRAPEARRTAAAGLAAAGVAAAVAWAWVPATRGFLADVRQQASTSRALEARLKADRVRIGVQVFTDFDFYFLDAPGWQVTSYHPRAIGGWPSLDLTGYANAFPTPSTASLDRFLDDCQAMGVTHLVLTPNAAAIQPDLGRLATGERTSPRVLEVEGIPGVRIFRLVG
ncbi:MAG: hypothetical protein R2745_11190 [Vicinamibacterales bacterium]